MLEVHGQDASKFSSWQAPNFSISSHCVTREEGSCHFSGSFCKDVKPIMVAPTSRVFLSLITSYKFYFPTLSQLGSAYPHINCQEHPDPKSMRSSLLICGPSQCSERVQILSFTLHNRYHKVYQRSNHLQFLEVDSYFFEETIIIECYFSR